MLNLLYEEEFNEYLEKSHNINTIFSESCVISITFAAMAIEGFIFDYGAVGLGDNFMKDYIDKLDTISKWIVIPKLITGKDFPKDRISFELLCKTIKLRNEFIHIKSKKYSHDNLETLLEKYSDESIKAISELAKDLESIDPNSHARFRLELHYDYD